MLHRVEQHFTQICAVPPRTSRPFATTLFSHKSEVYFLRSYSTRSFKNRLPGLISCEGKTVAWTITTRSNL